MAVTNAATSVSLRASMALARWENSAISASGTPVTRVTLRHAAAADRESIRLLAELDSARHRVMAAEAQVIAGGVGVLEGDP